ncbi:MAG TPA: alpha/beta hydrolase [Bacteriovoracaceae bacterium]|nr:alpha/beta hydrolase [Bacteriovoracaceae bacterium]
MRFLILLFLSSGCSGVFYQPSRNHFTEPAQFKLKHQEVFFESSDGTKLHGWFLPTTSKKPKGTIIQFHGNAENLSTHYLSLIWLIEQGYNLFTWDYRGYGKSEGKPSQAGIYLDALAALMKGRELHAGKGLLIVYGQSLGGAVSLRALPDFKYVNEINILVHDSGFASYQDVGFSVLKSRWFFWPFSPLAFLLVSDEYAGEKVLSKIHLPTLVVVGEKDPVVSAKLGKETYKKIPSYRKWLWILPEGRHIDVFHHGEERYRKQFLALLEQLSPH